MDNLTKDTYQVIAQASQGEYKEKGSKFLAYAYPLTRLEEFDLLMEEVKSIHPKARHHCYAYRIGIDGSLFRANDDGEPSGTAGKPILGQMLSHDISDCLVVVVRYFGGTKLGASGLINAYKSATHEALLSANTKQKTLNDRFKLTFDYAQMGHVLNVIKSLNLEIVDKVFQTTAFVILEIPKSLVQKSMTTLKARLLQISEEQIDDDTTIPFCSITQIEDND